MDPVTDITEVAAGGDEDLACPLCGYSLRGLTASRCPECGYPFDRAELRRKAKDHPYLFEHAVRRRRVRAFLLTLLHGLRPLRFWGSVKPTHEPRPRRVVVYWLLAIVMPVVLLLAGVYLEAAIRSTRWALDWRTKVVASLPPALAADPRVPGELDAAYPLPNRWVFHRRLWDAMSDDVAFFIGWAVVYAAWPWLTVAALSVFRISMRRARILHGHVLRCVVYSYDLVAVLAPLILVWAVAAGMSANVVRFTGGWTGLHEHDGMQWVALGSLVLLVIAMVRLMVAYRRYLRFHLPELVVLSAQVIVLLFVMAASFYIEELFFD